MEGKALTGPDGDWSPSKERALSVLIERVHPGKGGGGDVLAAEPVAFDSGYALATGRREPSGVVEREALERYRSHAAD